VFRPRRQQEAGTEERVMAEREFFFHYLPVTDLAIRWGDYLTGAGIGRTLPGQPYPQEGHPTLYDFRWERGRTLPEFSFHFITEGAGRFESHETGEVPIDPGSIFLLVPGVWHRYRPHLQCGWTERWFAYNGDVAHRLITSLGLKSACSIGSVRNPDQLADRFDALLERIHRRPTQNSIMLAIHAMALLVEAVEDSSIRIQTGTKTASPADTIDDPLIVRAREYIWTHSHRQLSIAQIARELRVTRRTLERRFQRAVGCSLLQDINACRLGRAQRLLAETTLPVKTVAHLAGFPSDEQMRVTFVQLTGRSPGQYRGGGGMRKGRAARPSP
jgi:AraC-like DNA-binding protein